MSSFHLAPGAVLPALLVSTIAAQTAPPGWLPEEQPGYVHLGDVHPTSGAAGNFFGHELPAIATRYDGLVRVAYSPARHDSSVAIYGAFEDVARLRSASEDQDRLVTAGSSGVQAHAWDWKLPASGRSFVTTTLWPGAASSVACADLDGDGDDEMIVLDDDQVTVRVLEADATGAFTVSASHSLASPVLQVEPVRWTGGPSSEIAVLTATHAFIVAPDLSPVTELQVWGPGSLCAVELPIQSTPRFEGLAFLAENPAPGEVTDLLALVSAVTAPRFLETGAIDTVAVRSFAREAPFECGLAISERGDRGLRLVSVTWDASLGIELADLGGAFTDPMSGHLGNEAEPVVADLDHDGDEDIFFPAPGGPRLCNSPEIDDASFEPDLSAPGVSSDDDCLLTIPLILRFPATTGASAVRVRYWKQERPNRCLDALSASGEATEDLNAVGEAVLTLVIRDGFGALALQYLELQPLGPGGQAVGAPTNLVVGNMGVLEPIFGLNYLPVPYFGSCDLTLPGTLGAPLPPSDPFDGSTGAYIIGPWVVPLPADPDPSACQTEPPGEGIVAEGRRIQVGSAQGGGAGCIPTIPTTPPDTLPEPPEEEADEGTGG